MHIDDLEFQQKHYPDRLRFADDDSLLFDLFPENRLDVNNFPRIKAEVILAEPMRLALQKGTKNR